MGRPLPAHGDHLVDQIRFAGKQRLDRAVAPVAHPSIEAQAFGHLLRPAAEPYALHSARNPDPDALDLDAVGLVTHGTLRQKLRASGKLHDHFIDRKTVAGSAVDLGDRAVALGAQDVLHLHGLDHTQTLARLD